MSKRRRSRQGWVGWAWGLSLTTMSTGCCICGRWVPAHDSLYVKQQAGPLDPGACAALCGADATCFDATAHAVGPRSAPRMLCVDEHQGAWDVPAPDAPPAPPAPAPVSEPLAVAEPPPDEAAGGSTSKTPARCAPCNLDHRQATDCSPLPDAQVPEGERLVVCFRHQSGGCFLDGPAGRRAPGVEPAPSEIATTDGRYFARLAHAEAVSVRAFRSLARDLARLGAPRRLVRWAARSGREEERHALVMRRLAKRRGEAPPRVRGEPRPARSLLDLALHNGVEGCVLESFAALVCVHQGRHARDADARRAFGRIAREELSHAALSREIHRYVMRRLDPAERAEVGGAMRAALTELAAAPRMAAAQVEAAVGLPCPHARAELARRLPAR